MGSAPFTRLPRTTRTFVVVVVVCGSAAVADAFRDLYVHPIGWTWLVLAALTLVSGSATVNLPSLPATVSVSETFVFTSVLLFGCAPGTLTVALDALVISIWSYKKGHPAYKIIFNVCAVPLAMWLASHLYYQVAPYGPLHISQGPVLLKNLLWPLIAFTVSYYGLNTWFVTLAIALEKRLSPIAIWRDHFLWLALNYFGGASVAALLISYTKDLDYTYLLIIIPLLAVLYLTFSTSMGRVEDANKHLRQLNALYMSTIETLAMAIDAKDQITHGHLRRVQSYAVGLARLVGVKEEAQIRAIEAAALLHDMGKLAVPEYILNKPGPLTPAEFEKMKLHASVGADILSSIDFPYPVVPIVRHHHENWDGTGYPDGLAGTNIPIGARILSVVDCFDALTSDRPYRPRLPDRDALRILQQRRASMYDPLIVDTFIGAHEELGVALSNADSRLSEQVRTGVPRNPLAGPRIARLEQIAASSDEMVTLYDLSRALTSTSTLTDSLDVVFAHLRRLVPASTYVFFVHDIEQDDLRVVYVSGEHSELLMQLRLPLGQRLSGWVAANRRTIRNSDPVLDLGEAFRVISPRLRSSLSTAVVADQSLTGVLSVYSARSAAFTDEHERIIETVARQIGPVVAERLPADGRLVPTQLTGFPSHVPSEGFFEDDCDKADANSVLILVQCSFLESLNKPHENNDLIKAIRALLRPTDSFLRTGTHEFAVILRNANVGDASRVRELIVRLIASRVPDLGRVVCEIGTSFGTDGTVIESLLASARARLQRFAWSETHQPGSIH